jgi:putative membrane protein
MRALGYALTLLGALCAVAVGGLFALQNTQTIALDLLFIQLPPQPVAIWILLALSLGVVLGLLAGTLLAIRRAATIRSLRRQRDRLLKSINGSSEGARSE